MLCINSSLHQGVCPWQMRCPRSMPVRARLERRRLFQWYEIHLCLILRYFLSLCHLLFLFSSAFTVLPLSTCTHSQTDILHIDNRKEEQLVIIQVAHLHIHHSITHWISFQWKQQGSITACTEMSQCQPLSRFQCTSPEGRKAAPRTLTQLLFKINKS